jgi:LmbE family N-acetylglucosaminyl deacetylase
MYDKPTLRKVIDLFRRVAPTMVFTHALRDYMLDHEQTALLARGASFLYAAPYASSHPRPANAGVGHLYYCDPLEGKDPLGAEVTPTAVIDIAAVQEKKLRMLACHESQREWLRAHHGIDEHDAKRGKLIGSAAGEAFVQHRGHAYPADDLLARLLGRPNT